MPRFLFVTVRGHGAITRTRWFSSDESFAFSYSTRQCARTRWFSANSDSEESRRHSFTVSFLMNSLGFSENNALSASKIVALKSSEKPEKCIEFFEAYGLTRQQIRALVKSHPRVLLSDAEKNIFPKLEFLVEKGLSRHDLGSMISKFPRLCQSSLAGQIEPSFDFWRSVFGSNEKTVSAVKHSPDLLTYNLEISLSPNIECLRRNGTNIENIFQLAVQWPRILVRCPNEFEKAVEAAAKMGFDASKSTFVKATVAILLGKRESRWERKVETFKKFGWSEKDFSVAFSGNPTCMFFSSENIAASMEFFVGEMGLEPAQVAKWPTVLGYSLKRSKLRCSVYRVLLSKGLIRKNDVRVMSLVSCTENKFIKKYLKPYAEESPELLDLYKGNTGSKRRTSSLKK